MYISLYVPTSCRQNVVLTQDIRKLLIWMYMNDKQFVFLCDCTMYDNQSQHLGTYMNMTILLVYSSVPVCRRKSWTPCILVHIWTWRFCLIIAQYPSVEESLGLPGLLPWPYWTVRKMFRDILEKVQWDQIPATASYYKYSFFPLAIVQ